MKVEKIKSKNLDKNKKMIYIRYEGGRKKRKNYKY